MTERQRCDLAIVIPKHDELNAFQQAFGITLGKSEGKLGDKRFWIVSIPTAPDLSIAVVLLNGQGNVVATDVTRQLLSKLDPALLFLIGTAVGRKDAIHLGSVVVSSVIVDAQERRVEKGSVRFRTKQYETPEAIRVDVGRFFESKTLIKDWRRKLSAVCASLCPEAQSVKERWRNLNVELAHVASSNDLNLDPAALQQLWNIDDRIRCADMESAGFALTLRNELQRQWLTVRGISDFGTRASKTRANRLAATASAALLLRTFIESGLSESHPHSLRVPESSSSELSKANYYARFDATKTMTEALRKKLRVDLTGIDLGASLTLSDFESLCVARGADRIRTRAVLSETREEYFTGKYLNYSYEDDLRGLIPTWAHEVRDILLDVGIDPKRCTVIDVGIGNGLEAPYIFMDVRRLIGVDVSRKSLAKARATFLELECHDDAAENLRHIKTSSADVYVSLRTYQSSFFDVSAALREAQRVLRSRGLLIVSVANGFVDIESGSKKVIRGLLVPGTRRVIDRNSPRKLADQIVQKLEDLGFEGVSYKSTKTDIYIWGQRP
jgi:nucleoside phosphorylase/ubiquinone/menaquinone biosynthesis C-methylase UbiE